MILFEFIEINQERILHMIHNVLRNLDPSLFQNIILASLAIFIPFAIVFLADLLSSRGDVKSEFEKMVLNDKVLKAQEIFWISIIGTFFFTFFSGNDVSNPAKIITIFAAIFLSFFYWFSFRKLLRFAEGYSEEFEISFLKSLNFSRILRYKNEIKAKKMANAWNSLWSTELESRREKDFTEIFMSHIDKLIDYGKINVAVELAQIYVIHITKRNRFSIALVLSKVFEWNARLWNERELSLKKYDAQERFKKMISQLISKKHLPTFRSYILNAYEKLNTKQDFLWNWHYFEINFLQTIAKEMLQDDFGSYRFFTLFKKHIDESVKKLNEIANEEKKERYKNYIVRLVSNFCSFFFNEVDNLSNDEVWLHFPKEWRIAKSNIKNWIPHIILREFLSWAEDRIFRGTRDKSLTEVMNGIFPNVHPALFTGFLRLLFSFDIKDALEKRENFHIFEPRILMVGAPGESPEEKLTKTLRKKELLQKEETIHIIVHFFDFWPRVYKDDLSEEELEEVENNKGQKAIKMFRVKQREKLEQMQRELKSDEIKKMCQNDDRKEVYRKIFLELIELLLEEKTSCLKY